MKVVWLHKILPSVTCPYLQARNIRCCPISLFSSAGGSGQPCTEQGCRVTGDAELQFCWDASWLETAYTFPLPKGLQGGVTLRRKLQLLCLGLEAKVGSVETSGWTIGKGDGGRGSEQKAEGFYLTIPSL